MTNVTIASPTANVVVSGNTVTVATVGTQGPAGGTGLGVPPLHEDGSAHKDGSLITFKASAGNFVATNQILNSATIISGGHF